VHFSTNKTQPKSLNIAIYGLDFSLVKDKERDWPFKTRIKCKKKLNDEKKI
jgi:hypothetical protein